MGSFMIVMLGFPSMRRLEEPVMSRAQKAPAIPALASYVRHVRVVPEADVGSRYVRLPDGEVELFVQARSSGVAATVTGTRQRVLAKDVTACADYTYVVRFNAGGAYPFFGVPLSELTDEIVSLGDLWGADANGLASTFEGPASVEARLSALQGALVARLRGGKVFEPAAAMKVRRAVHWMREEPRVPTVEDVSGRIGLSARQLRRAFAEVVGVSPKTYGRIVRFQRAFRAARSGSREWRAIALASGYFDQAHMIADFRALAGVTPGALFANRVSW
jgi:AraC-like DNA-binding protein